MLAQSVATDTEAGRDAMAAFPGEVALDRVVKVTVRSFSGHVYNLETEGHWYVANGIVTHNCRCFYAPVTRSWREMGLDIDDPGHRRRMDGKRPENMDFESWLKRQPVERQVEVFGPARHDMWSNGRLRMDRFSDQGRVLNLGELAARYPSA
jgi:hypothetical protein